MVRETCFAENIRIIFHQGRLYHRLIVQVALYETDSIFNLFFKEWHQSTIAGLVFGLYAFMYSLYNNFSKDAQKASKDTQKALEMTRELSQKCVELLKIHNEFLNDQWLYESLDRIVLVHDNTKQHQTFLELARKEIDQGINEAHDMLRGKKIDYSGWERELSRQKCLKDIVANSRHYVKAVTSYDPKYWEQFWEQPGFSESYRRVNLEAANKGVSIDRIFILPSGIVNQEGGETLKRIQRIVQPMLNQHNNLKIYFVLADNIPKAIHPYKRYNFLVSDDLFVGVSHDFSDQENTEGYVTINVRDEVEKMLTVFSNLSIYAKSPESFDFLNESED